MGLSSKKQMTDITNWTEFYSIRTHCHEQRIMSTTSMRLSNSSLVLLGSSLLFHPLDVNAHAPPVAGSYSAISSATTPTSLMSLSKCSAAATRLLHRSWSRQPRLSLDLSSRAGGPRRTCSRPRPHWDRAFHWKLKSKTIVVQIYSSENRKGKNIVIQKKIFHWKLKT
jgi:hypothetical protein